MSLTPVFLTPLHVIDDSQLLPGFDEKPVAENPENALCFLPTCISSPLRDIGQSIPSNARAFRVANSNDGVSPKRLCNDGAIE
jgi:hypothetical protein